MVVLTNQQKVKRARENWHSAGQYGYRMTGGGLRLHGEGLRIHGEGLRIHGGQYGPHGAGILGDIARFFGNIGKKGVTKALNNGKTYARNQILPDLRAYTEKTVDDLLSNSKVNKKLTAPLRAANKDLHDILMNSAQAKLDSMKVGGAYSGNTKSIAASTEQRQKMAKLPPGMELLVGQVVPPGFRYAKKRKPAKRKGAGMLKL